MGTLLLKPLFWAVGDIFKGSGVGELGAGSIWPERILTNPSCWVSFQCSFIHWIHWRYFQGWKNNLQVHRGVYFTSSSPPPWGGMIIHQGKENSKYVQFFKKLRKNGDKRKQLREWGWKLMFLLINCRIRQYLLIFFLQFCQWEGKFGWKGGVDVYSWPCKIYTPEGSFHVMFYYITALNTQVHD